MAKPVDKMVGQTTTKSTDLLEQQLAQVAGAIPKNQWGETSGCITLVLNKAAFREATGITDGVVNSQVNPLLEHPGINKDSTMYNIMVKQEEPKEIIQDFNTQ